MRSTLSCLFVKLDFEIAVDQQTRARELLGGFRTPGTSARARAELEIFRQGVEGLATSQGVVKNRALEYNFELGFQT